MANYDIQRFVKAQEQPCFGYQQALSEIQRGQKRGHWIWYIFPQMKGLGYSQMSEYYGITGLKEAQDYVANEILSHRLREITYALMSHRDKTLEEILGYVDDLKVRSCMTLFDAVCPNDLFGEVLNQFYGGERCQRTLEILNGK